MLLSISYKMSSGNGLTSLLGAVEAIERYEELSRAGATSIVIRDARSRVTNIQQLQALAQKSDGH